ncbi:hypothetical protein ACIRP2_24795 [Streptomyces sp. NPDC101194]|uniref:hypothetical protein n=1 Tax=Streptomyces sp. NPDC101194 TaxID=3366127 RepID=UPI00381A6196
MSDSMPGPGTVHATTSGATSGEAAQGSPDEDTVPGAATVSEPAAPAPLGIARTPTGNAEVDARLERLADADHLTADGHVEVYEDVHRGLRDALTALDAGPAPAPMPSYNHRS